MCLAFPGRVKEIQGRKAIIKYPDEERDVFMSDVKVDVGDYVLVQMGIILRKLSKKEALDSLSAWGFKNPNI